MICVEIHGKSYPLCLTVAALDEINEKIGGISGITTFLNGGEDASYEQMFENTVWLLELLLREGEENRLICEHFADGVANPVRREIPDLKAIRSGFTLASIAVYRASVLAAVSESMSQTIEAAYSKKKENGEQG